jgi:polysaccharide pyruvyl transferase WcaK-like protein
MTQRESNLKNVAFFGPFDSSNFGNEATLGAILYHLRRFHPDVDVVCISTSPEATIASHKIKAIPTSETLLKFPAAKTPFVKMIRRVFVVAPNELYGWIKGFMRLRSIDLLIIPGTGLLTDAYGLARWGPYNIFKWSLISKLCGCKLVFVSVGVGPIFSGLGRYLVRSSLSMAAFRSYRDHSSKQYLIGIRFCADNDPVYPDLAFSLYEVVAQSRGANKGCRPVVGIGLIGYGGQYSVAKPSMELYRAYLDNLVNFGAWLLANGYHIRLLIGDVGDRDATQEFRRLFFGSGLDITNRHDGYCGGNAIPQCDFFIAL